MTSYVWTIDTVAPTVTLSIKPPNPTNDTTPDFAFSANETVPAGFQCQLDAAAFAACTSPKALTTTADGSHTFTVKAIDAAGNTGQTSYTWTIDTAVPQITLGTKPTNPTNDTTPDFAFSANETLLGGFQCQLDGAAFAACTSPKTLPATADGSHTFTVKAIDTAGNPGQTSYTWTIDTDPSTITLTQTPSNFSSDSTPTFAFTADEPIPGGFQCRLDAGGTFAPCSSPTTLSATADGPHTFTVRGSDAAGNLGQTSYAWTIDTVAPALSLTAKPPDPSGVSTAHFEFSATDQTSVTYQCQLDAGAFQSCTSPKDFSGLANGTHSFTAKGTDAAGNTGSASYSWSVDTAVPVVTINPAPENPTNLTGATFGFTSNKLPSTFECRLDGGGFSVCTSPKTYGPLLAGAHSFQARATDSLGHTGPATTYSWTIDLTPPPTPAISSAPASPSNSSSPSFVFTDGEAGANFQCQLDGGAFVSCASPRAYSGLADGPHSFNVKAIDAAGNQSGPAGHTWTIDTVAPTITLGTKPVDPTNDSTPDFAFSANETISGGFQCKLDAGAFAACTSPKTLPATADGSHTFTVKANDTAGNTGQTSYTWTIDTVAPTVTLSIKPPNPTNDATPDFRVQRERDDLRRLPVQARRRRLRRLHEPEDTSGNGRRIAHLHGEGERHGGKHGADELHLDDRHRSADDHAGRAAAEPLQRRNADLHLQRGRGHARRLPVQARRWRLRRLHEPEDIRYDPGRIAHLHGQGRRRGGEQQLDELRVDDRHERARPDSHEDAGGPQRGGHRALRVQRY